MLPAAFRRRWHTGAAAAATRACASVGAVAAAPPAARAAVAGAHAAGAVTTIPPSINNFHYTYRRYSYTWPDMGQNIFTTNIEDNFEGFYIMRKC